MLPAALLLACVIAGAVLAATPRTIVVRGRTLTPEGQPIAGARVQVRGTESVVAQTDEQGRYTVSVPLGMPAALRQLPFKMEVRAEGGGHKLSLAGGGSALVIDAAWNATKGVVLVKSNREAAAKSVAASIELEELAVAPIEADFGGVAKAGANGSFTSEAALPGTAAAAGAATKQATPSPPSDSSKTLPAVGAPATAAATKSAAPAPASASAAPGATKPPAPAAAVPVAASTKSAPVARDTIVIGDPAARATVSGAPNPAAAKPTPRSRAARAAQVRAIAGLAGPDTLAASDSCRCNIRGTVEIDWKRPLEDHTSVQIELDAPGAQPAEISLFMGAPREFRFGPIPCGAWRMSVKAKGKLRYTDARGDTARVIPCAGTVETRVVLVPAKR